MESQKLAANTENRTYYFYIVQQKDNEVSILMYSTPYTLVKNEDGWANHPANKLKMVQRLVDAVIEAIPAS